MNENLGLDFTSVKCTKGQYNKYTGVLFAHSFSLDGFFPHIHLTENVVIKGIYYKKA